MGHTLNYKYYMTNKDKLCNKTLIKQYKYIYKLFNNYIDKLNK